MGEAFAEVPDGATASRGPRPPQRCCRFSGLFPWRSGPSARSNAMDHTPDELTDVTTSATRDQRSGAPRHHMCSTRRTAGVGQTTQGYFRSACGLYLNDPTAGRATAAAAMRVARKSKCSIPEVRSGYDVARMSARVGDRGLGHTAIDEECGRARAVPAASPSTHSPALAIDGRVARRAHTDSNRLTCGVQ